MTRVAFTRRFGVIATLILVALLMACTDATITTVAKSLDDSAKAVGTLQTTVIQANTQKLISDNDTAAILTICASINSAGLQVSQATRGVNSLNPAQKMSLLSILNPIVAAVQRGLLTNLLSIQDPNTRTTVQAALTAIQTALAAAQVVLAK